MKHFERPQSSQRCPKVAITNSLDILLYAGEPLIQLGNFQHIWIVTPLVHANLANRY